MHIQTILTQLHQDRESHRSTWLLFPGHAVEVAALGRRKVYLNALPLSELSRSLNWPHSTTDYEAASFPAGEFEIDTRFSVTTIPNSAMETRLRIWSDQVLAVFSGDLHEPVELS